MSRPDLIVAHVASLGAILGTMAGALPPIAALGAIVWYIIQIGESRFARVRYRLWRAKRRAKRLAARVAQHRDV